MTWQTYCNKYEALLANNKELTSIRQDLFFRLKANRFKAFVRFGFSILSVFKHLLVMHKKTDVLNIENLYFIDSPTSANLGTLKPLYLKDESKKMMIINSHVEKSESFQVLKNSCEYINFTNFHKLYFKDLSFLFTTSRTIAKHFDTSFFIVFPLLCRYIIVKNALSFILKGMKTKNIILSNDTLLTSNTALHVARKNSVKDYTLQHGFLTHFYVPTTTTNYIVWEMLQKNGLKKKVYLQLFCH